MSEPGLGIYFDYICTETPVKHYENNFGTDLEKFKIVYNGGFHAGFPTCTNGSGVMSFPAPKSDFRGKWNAGFVKAVIVKQGRSHGGQEGNEEMSAPVCG